MAEAGKDLNKKPILVVRSLSINICEQTTTCATDNNKAHWIFQFTLNKQCYSNTLLYFNRLCVMHHMI